MIDELIFHPEILFDWGQKSMHAYLDSRDEELQHFCNPETVDKGLIMNYINKYLIYLKRYISRNKKLRTSYDVNIKIEQLKTDINREENNERLLLIKEWLIYAFHTMGVKEFAKISP